MATTKHRHQWSRSAFGKVRFLGHLFFLNCHQKCVFHTRQNSWKRANVQWSEKSGQLNVRSQNKNALHLKRKKTSQTIWEMQIFYETFLSQISLLSKDSLTFKFLFLSVWTFVDYSQIGYLRWPLLTLWVLRDHTLLSVDPNLWIELHINKWMDRLLIYGIYYIDMYLKR